MQYIAKQLYFHTKYINMTKIRSMLCTFNLCVGNIAQYLLDKEYVYIVSFEVIIIIKTRYR